VLMLVGIGWSSDVKLLMSIGRGYGFSIPG
jgi:hypothetical protein